MIQITSIRQPETGAIIAVYCEKCKRTVIVWNVYAAKPKDGNMWLIQGFCMNSPACSLDWPPNKFELEPRMLNSPQLWQDYLARAL